MKKILIALLVIVVLIAGGTWYLFSNLDKLVAGAIERHGGKVTGTEVSVTGVDIALGEGSASIKGLGIGNPAGFSDGDAFSLGEISVDLDLQSLRDEPMVIEEIRIAAPVVNAEILADAKSNIDELRKAIEAHVPAVEKGGDGEPTAVKRIRVKRFIFDQGSVAVDASALGLEPRTVTLPSFQIDDIGGESGALPEEIAKVALTALAKQAGEEIARGEIKGLIEEKLGGSVEDAAAGLLKKLGN